MFCVRRRDAQGARDQRLDFFAAGPRHRGRSVGAACASPGPAYQQVKIYIDDSNFIRTWTQVVHGRDRPLEHDINWTTPPQAPMEEMTAWL